VSASPIAAGASLRAEDLACRRGERIVLRGVGFALAGGEALVLRGPNGSGKSSLLRTLAGLIEPASGRLLRDGAPVADDPDRHRASLAYLGHLDALKPDFTLRENVAAAAELAGADGSRVDAALDAFALAALAGVPARFLSQGQRRRAALARLLAAPATLWLLDEPTLALDAAAVARLGAALAAHLAGGGLAAIATHVDLPLPAARTLTLATPEAGTGPAP
jgi:heme exporter protein A